MAARFIARQDEKEPAILQTLHRACHEASFGRVDLIVGGVDRKDSRLDFFQVARGSARSPRRASSKRPRIRLGKATWLLQPGLGPDQTVGGNPQRVPIRPDSGIGSPAQR